jgi:hypothetical protein
MYSKGAYYLTFAFIVLYPFSKFGSFFHSFSVLFYFRFHSAVVQVSRQPRYIHQVWWHTHLIERVKKRKKARQP